MGWTNQHAEFYKKNGEIDRKAELDKIFSQEEHDGSDYNGGTCHYPQYKVLKSTMVGTVYYAAIEISEEATPEDTRVFAMVALTSVDKKDYFNFGYKDMSESMHPYYYDCPKGILDLLTHTDIKEANDWRGTCREKLKNKKEKTGLNHLPIGTQIKFTSNGKEVKLFKHEPGYQFKRPFWFDGVHYWKTTQIPEEFEIIKVGA